MPVFTGKYTKVGRPLWQPTAEDIKQFGLSKYGFTEESKYSEITRTIPVSTDKEGNPLPGTKWANVPTVFDGGKILDDEDFLTKFYSENNYKDPITKKAIEMYDNAEEAVKAAKNRSANELIDE